jgi:hypothetical protein
MATLSDDALAVRLALIEDEAWGDDIAGEDREPTESELLELSEELLKAAAEGTAPPARRQLREALTAMADKLGVGVDEVRATMAGSEGPEAAWQVTLAVLEMAVDPDWLTAVEGRDGKPLSAAEAGEDRHDRVTGSNVIVPDGRDGKGLAKHWWSRG